MISAIDTNILLDLARPNPDFVDNAVDLLEQASVEGAWLSALLSALS